MQERQTIAGFSVTAPARLHLGFLDLSGGLGRTYGSIGLAVDAPATEITRHPRRRLRGRRPRERACAPDPPRSAEALGARGRYRADVKRAIPPHAGLGSGTQLALAISQRHHAPRRTGASPQELGNLAGRGARSSIGMAAFESGGFIIDGGRGAKDRPPPILVRTDFPEAWRALLVLDPKAQGAHGDREAKAFAALPPVPRNRCRQPVPACAHAPPARH